MLSLCQRNSVTAKNVVNTSPSRVDRGDNPKGSAQLSAAIEIRLKDIVSIGLNGKGNVVVDTLLIRFNV